MKTFFIGLLIIFLSLKLSSQERMSIYALEEGAVPDTIQLEEVTVTAFKATEQTPIAFSNVKGETLQKRNWGGALPYLLSHTPSVVLSSDAGNGIGYVGMKIRGTDDNRINFTLDGVPMNDAESHELFWVNLPDIASSLSGVQIQRGVGTSVNGVAAFGATVSMQSRIPSIERKLSATASAGSYGTRTITLSGESGELGSGLFFDARVARQYSDGFIDRAFANLTSYDARLYYNSGNTLLKVQTFGSEEHTYQAWDGVPSDLWEEQPRYNGCGAYTVGEETRFYDNQTDNYFQHHYRLVANQRFGTKAELSLTLFFTDGNGYYEDYKEDAKYASYLLSAPSDDAERGDLIRRKWLDNIYYGGMIVGQIEPLNLRFGGSYSRYLCDHFGRVIWAANAVDLTPDYEYYRNRGDKTDYNLFVKWEETLAGCLPVYVDMQYRGIDYSIVGTDDKAGDIDVHRHWDFFNPKAGVGFRKGMHYLYASAAMAHREPNRDNFTEAGENERPTYETLYDYEMGYRCGDVTRRGYAALNLFYMAYDNQLILNGKISDIGEQLTTNIPDSYRTGIEMEGSCLLRPWLSLQGNLSLSRHIIRSFTAYIDNWDEGGQTAFDIGDTHILLSPEVVANFEIATEGEAIAPALKGLSASLNAMYVSRQYLDNTASLDRSLPAYGIVNAAAGYRFASHSGQKIALACTVNNLFNHLYAAGGWVYPYIYEGKQQKSDGLFTQAGRNFLIRLSIDLQ